MELELHGWKVTLALFAVALAVVAIPLLRAVHANKDRAEGWHRRAVVAEESVSGLRVVIADRSRALNQRTVAANRLAGQLHSNRASLQQSKSSVSSLAAKQSALAKEKAKADAELQTLRGRVAALERIARRLDACTKAKARAPDSSTDTRSSASVPALSAVCTQASASLDAYLEQTR